MRSGEEVVNLGAKRQAKHGLYTNVLILDDEALLKVFQFVGIGHYRYVAGTSRRFRLLYKHFLLCKGNQLSTSGESIVESVSRASLFCTEVGPQITSNSFLTLGTIRSFRPLYLGNEVTAIAFVRDMAARNFNGRFDVLRWARSQKGCDHDPRACTLAAEKGHLKVLEWLHRNRYKWNADTCSAAAQNGHLDLLRWLRSKLCPWNASACAAAARNGYLDVLKWSRRNGCSWDADTCAFAAANGHFEVLKWAHENGCRWDSETCSRAAANGQLDLLKWARARGCPWDFHTIENASRSGHLAVLEWARANGCPTAAIDDEAALLARLLRRAN